MSARSHIVTCETNIRDTIHFNGEMDTPALYANRAGSEHFVSVYPSRNDLIRLRRAIGEYLKATRKVKP